MWVWIAVAIAAVAALAGLSLWMRFYWFLYKNGRRREVPVTPRRFFYSLYSIIVFTFMVYGVAAPVTLGMWIAVRNRRRRVAVYHRFLCWSARVILRAIPGVDFTFDNATGETFETPGVIISNHQGHFDLMCILMMTPRLIVLTNNRVWRNPLYGWIIRRADYLPADGAVVENADKLRSIVDQGYSVVIFPEGTRSPQCKILRFHTGAFHLAMQLGVDIIPVMLHGVGDVIPKEDFMLRKGSMYLTTLPRITPVADDDPLAPRRLASATRAMYIKEYDALCRRRLTSGYFVELVKYKYSYLVPGLKRNITHRLRANDNYSALIDVPYPDGATINVLDGNYGAVAWLMALVHPRCNVTGVIHKHRHLAMASRTPSPPANLTFSQWPATDPTAITVDAR